MKLIILATVFATVFAASFVAAADVQTVTIGANGPPDGIPACSSFQDTKCCITSLVCQCYDGNFYSGNSGNKCTPTVGALVADKESKLPGYCC